jgi:hypothetical protein
MRNNGQAFKPGTQELEYRNEGRSRESSGSYRCDEVKAGTEQKTAMQERN